MNINGVKNLMSTITNILNDLITISKDGEQGFKKVAEEVTTEHLKSTFSDRAQKCVEAISELQKCVEELGETPTDSGSILGTLHRGWIDIKSSIMGRDTYSILEECERGEEAAKKVYESALKAELPMNIRELIEKQCEGVKQSYDLVCNLKSQYAKE
jgi:uncharacterized protein (TIGR02284 family)